VRRPVLLAAAAVTATLAMACPGPARAQAPQEPIGGGKFNTEEGPGQPADYRSPQAWAVELRFGPYRPDVDSEFSGPNKPYTDFFGDGSSFLFTMEVDRQLWHGFGSFAIGASLGYFSDSAKSCLPGSCAMRSAADESSINIIPFTLVGVYRFDVPALKLNIPLVPYGKFGLAYDLWWITNGAGDTANFTSPADPNCKSGCDAHGGTLGYVAAAGLALMLDWLDPGSAVSLDSELGINHTYFFFELYSVVANGLGQSHALHVGDTTWAAGLAFEF
jgi:hypothetical protein